MEEKRWSQIRGRPLTAAGMQRVYTLEMLAEGAKRSELTFSIHRVEHAQLG